MKALAIILTLSFWSSVLITQEASLQEQFENFVQDESMKHASVSLAVFDSKKDVLVAAVDEHRSLIPASSLKLITTLSSIELLGEDYQFETRISYQGEILEDGTLMGDLIIRGSGDPSLGTTYFKKTLSLEALIEHIKDEVFKIGISCVDGQILADLSLFEGDPVNPNWQWNDVGNYYASGSWGINVFENEYEIYFQQTETLGDIPAIHHVKPQIPGLHFINKVRTASAETGDQAYIFGGPYQFYKIIRGTIPAGKGLFKIRGSIPDPPKYFLQQLYSRLDQEGIQSQGYRSVNGKYSKRKSTHITRIYSPELGDLVKRANRESHNLYCESFIKTLGLQYHGMGSTENGIQSIYNFLEELNLQTVGLHMTDGSGLSARNLMSSYVMVRFLDQLLAQMGLRNFCSFLPLAGKEGTVKSMLAKSKAKGSVWVKSGSMEKVLSYTGLVKTKKGNELVFCFIINAHAIKNSQMSKKLEDLMELLYHLG